jgi:hypothetical protein
MDSVSDRNRGFRKVTSGDQQPDFDPDAVKIPPLWKELKTKRFWILIGIAFVCIAISTVWEQNVLLKLATIPDDEMVKHFRSVWWESDHTYIGLIREVGFASFIALAIGVLVERATQARQISDANTLLQDVARNVFLAAAGWRAPDSIRTQVLDTILYAKVLRPKITLRYTVKPLAIDWGEQLCRTFLILEVQSDYALLNLGGAVIRDYKVNLHIPRAEDASLDELVCANRVVIGTTQLAEEDVQNGLQPETQFDKRYEWPIELEPGLEKRVIVQYTLIKRVADDEPWTSLLPCERLELVVDMQCPGLAWRAEAYHMGELRLIGDRPRRGLNHFEAQQAILPYQGIVLEWRPAPSAEEAGLIPDRGNASRASDVDAGATYYSELPAVQCDGSTES